MLQRRELFFYRRELRKYYREIILCFYRFQKNLLRVNRKSFPFHSESQFFALPLQHPCRSSRGSRDNSAANDGQLRRQRRGPRRLLLKIKL